MQTTVTIENDALIGRSDELIQKLAAADESLRKSFAGLPVDEVVPEIERSLVEIGVEVPDLVVRDYAQHVADRADYELVLR